jgi:hypothetical protein
LLLITILARFSSLSINMILKKKHWKTVHFVMILLFGVAQITGVSRTLANVDFSKLVNLEIQKFLRILSTQLVNKEI